MWRLSSGVSGASDQTIAILGRDADQPLNASGITVIIVTHEHDISERLQKVFTPWIEALYNEEGKKPNEMKGDNDEQSWSIDSSINSKTT